MSDDPTRHNQTLIRGRYRARVSIDAGDVAKSIALRTRVFRGDAGPSDADRFDASCDHVLVEEAQTGRLCASVRLLYLDNATAIESSYSAQFYDLARLSAYRAPLAEMGRFCVDPDLEPDPDILRLAWGAVTRYVDARGIGLLFGCSSFPGTDPKAHQTALSLLRARHLAPAVWMPGARAETVYPFGAEPLDAPDVRAGLAGMPPLLRTYVAMGGWVSDHAVIDQDLGTLHVFTGLEIAAIPPARARALRAL